MVRFFCLGCRAHCEVASADVESIQRECKYGPRKLYVAFCPRLVQKRVKNEKGRLVADPAFTGKVVCGRKVTVFQRKSTGKASPEKEANNGPARASKRSRPQTPSPSRQKLSPVPNANKSPKIREAPV